MASDSKVIARSLRRGSAFEAIFERHFDVVYRYLRRQAGTAAAEDLAAETFARAFTNRRSYDLNYDDARPWLFGIATNVLRAHWRATGRVTIPLLDSPDDFGADADARIDAAASLAGYAEALRALPSEQLEVLLLFGVAELSYEEIAVALGVAVGTVRSRLHRAREALTEVPR